MKALELVTTYLSNYKQAGKIRYILLSSLILKLQCKQKKKTSLSPTETSYVYQEKDPWISASQALFDCKVCINFDLGVPARAAWSALSAEGWSLGIGGLPLEALLPFGCKGVLGGRVGGVIMTPFVIWAGGSGSISGGLGRFLRTGGKGEGWDELGAVFSVLPEGELLELDFCRRYILFVKWNVLL